MGCDIHYTFIAGPKHDRRDVPSKTDLWRNYDVFNVLAGMRPRWEAPHVEPRGKLEEPAAKQFNEAFDDWCFGFGWLTTEEVMKAVEMYEDHMEITEYTPAHACQLRSIVGEMRALDFPDSPCLFVFCFDN